MRITTVYVTHDQIEAMTLADRIVVMRSGAIQQVGTPDQIYTDPANAFVAGFIGSPPMNLIEGRLAGGRFEAPGVAVDGLSAPDGPAVLGVRPEDCAVAEAGEIEGEVYGLEPTGDVTFLTLLAGEKRVEVKADRAFRAPLGAPAAVRLDRSRLYLFDAGTGERVRGA